ncbi:CPXCG motif-containing cysteine-rich protein [Echinicola jeungdonensis]|uniref:CPXCG motif-containing cysteine-rich protein n=1 Tax=Echinicola jeungdonensis TaxID=709343 RepID=A0ABV5JAU8_9BACT|nr:CPXCG motif-containing cysteine-rich protein [Echinicola jeungdonensis]MDN3670190.1 CPXCG motif-containing cysteine-rich protein [Echinicola jeungdonensis]
MLTKEQFFTCPYCFSTISVILDLSVPRQKYIEDCEVCCRPIEISFEVDGEEIIFFSTNSLEE